MVLIGPPLFAQESILVSYQRNFVRANLTIKAEVLRDASTDERAAEFIGQLYDFSLRFSLQSAELLRDDPDMIALTALAAQGVRAAEYKASAETLWRLFLAHRDSFSRSEILGALGITGRGNTQIVDNLNQFLANQNSSFRSGMQIDNPVFQAAIVAVGNLGDRSSYPVLFATLMLQYPESVSSTIEASLDKIQGNYKQFLTDIIQKNPAAEKLAAFRLGAHNDKFTITERGEFAQTALEIGLNQENQVNAPALSSLRYEAVQLLAELKWNRAADLVIKHFYRVQTDYKNEAAAKSQLVLKDRLVEVISCLGKMESSEAAQVLALQLGLFNSQTEQNGSFDEDILISVIKALGEIGDKAAFDYLLYMGYLDYPDTIQIAAKNALSKLKW
jgi:hypothetical protein